MYPGKWGSEIFGEGLAASGADAGRHTARGKGARRHEGDLIGNLLHWLWKSRRLLGLGLQEGQQRADERLRVFDLGYVAQPGKDRFAGIGDIVEQKVLAITVRQRVGLFLPRRRPRAADGALVSPLGTSGA